MLQLIADYAIPLCLLLLMFIVGTDVEKRHFMELARAPRAVLMGSLGQLLTIPLIGLAANWLAAPTSVVAVGMMLLSVCPGGGVSNYYAYAARANVCLSVTLTALATVLSLVTIPAWLTLLPALSVAAAGHIRLPVHAVFAQLVMLMIVPIVLGAFVRDRWPSWIAANAARLRGLSSLIILLVLLLTTATIRHQLLELVRDIALVASIFVLAAMVLGRIMGIGLRAKDRPVLVIESGVRNIGVALLLGKAVFTEAEFAVFASFLTGYFIIEVIIMVSYAAITAATLMRHAPASPATANRSW